MIEVSVAPQARADIARIVEYLAAVASPATASQWNNRFWSTIDSIADFPGSGALRPRLGRDVRFKLVYPYLVIYLYERDAVVAHVLRVLHGRRRITRRLLREGT